MPGIKNIVKEMKNTFDRLIGRLDTAEKRNSDLEHVNGSFPN